MHGLQRIGPKAENLRGQFNGLCIETLLPLASGEVEIKVDLELLERLLVFGGTPLDRVLVSVGGLLEAVLPIKGVAVLEELVQQYQPETLTMVMKHRLNFKERATSSRLANPHDFVLVSGQRPRGGSQLGPLLEEALHGADVSGADGSVQRPHPVRVHALHLRPAV